MTRHPRRYAEALAPFILAPLAVMAALDIPPPRLIAINCTSAPIALLRHEDDAPGTCSAILPIVAVWSN